MSANSMISSNFASICASGHAVQPGREVHVVAHGEVVDEATGDLDERRDAARDLDRALVGDHDAGDELQQRRLALAVAADDADRLAGPHLDRHVAQRPELARTRAPPAAREQVLERATAAPVAAEADAEPVGADRVGSVAARRRSWHPSSDLLQHLALGAERNTQRPIARSAIDITAAIADVEPVELVGEEAGPVEAEDARQRVEGRPEVQFRAAGSVTP